MFLTQLQKRGYRNLYVWGLGMEHFLHVVKDLSLLVLSPPLLKKFIEVGLGHENSSIYIMVISGMYLEINFIPIGPLSYIKPFIRWGGFFQQYFLGLKIDAPVLCDLSYMQVFQDILVSCYFTDVKYKCCRRALFSSSSDFSHSTLHTARATAGATMEVKSLFNLRRCELQYRKKCIRTYLPL